MHCSIHLGLVLGVMLVVATPLTQSSELNVTYSFRDVMPVMAQPGRSVQITNDTFKKVTIENPIGYNIVLNENRSTSPPPSSLDNGARGRIYDGKVLAIMMVLGAGLSFLWSI